MNPQQRRASTTMQALAVGKGIVVLSTSAEETCKVNMTVVAVVRQGSGSSEGFINLNGGYQDSDFDDRFGAFDAFVLEPGSYQLQARILGSLEYVDAAIGWFRLQPGEIKYLGDVHAAGCNGFMGGGGGTFFREGNQWESVRPKLGRRFPGLDPSRVIVDLFWPDERVHRLPDAPASEVPAASGLPKVSVTATRPPELLPEEEPPRRPTWSLGIVLGAAGGGDGLLTARLTDGSEQTLRAGSGLTFAGYVARGLVGNARHALLIGVEGGVKGWNIGGGDTDFRVWLLRFPITPHLRYLFGGSPGGRLEVAAGPQIETGVHLSGSGAAAGIESRFNNALGAMGQLGAWFEGKNGHVGLSLRYTRLQYRGADLAGGVDATSLGLFFTFAWTRFSVL